MSESLLAFVHSLNNTLLRKSLLRLPKDSPCPSQQRWCPLLMKQRIDAAAS